MTIDIKEIYNHHFDGTQLLIMDALHKLDLPLDAMDRMHELSPYLILDGHRSGMRAGSEEFEGYIEGAKFSLRFATIFKKLGGRKSTFLIHTLRNYSTSGRMNSIFRAVGKIGKEFIASAQRHDIRLRYFGDDVHGRYTLADLINTAEYQTRDCDFSLNYITNYNEQWALDNMEQLEDLPEFNVVCRFTKGHYSGASVPTKHERANFLYCQQASIDQDWTDEEMILLILSLLKSYISVDGAIGGKKYVDDEKEEIHIARELNGWMESFSLEYDISRRTKQIISFEPRGAYIIRLNSSI